MAYRKTGDTLAPLSKPEPEDAELPLLKVLAEVDRSRKGRPRTRMVTTAGFFKGRPRVGVREFLQPNPTDPTLYVPTPRGVFVELDEADEFIEAFQAAVADLRAKVGDGEAD